MIAAAGGTAAAYACDVVRRRRGRARPSRPRTATSGASPVWSPRPASSTAPTCGPRTRSSVDDFLTVLAREPRRHVRGDQARAPDLVDGGGAIVTIASTAAIRGHGFGAGYTASKGGVDALTRLLAVQYGPHGVRANCICPGGVDTPMTGGTFATPEAIERAKRTVPIGRHAQAEDIGDVAVFLLGDDARHVTGVTLPVEGGATIA